MPILNYNADPMLDLASASEAPLPSFSLEQPFYTEGVKQEAADGMGEFAKGVARSTHDTIGAVLGGGIGLVGDITEIDPLKEFGFDFYKQQAERASQYSPNVAGITEVGSPSEYLDWLASTAGSLVPTIVGSVGSGGAGALIATAAKTGGNVAVKNVIKNAIKAGVERQLKKGYKGTEALRMALKDFGQTESGKITKQALQAAASGTVKKGAKRGAQIGTVGFTSTLESGYNWVDDVTANADQTSPFGDILFGIAAGMLDLVGAEGLAISSIFGRNVGRNLARKTGTEAAKKIEQGFAKAATKELSKYIGAEGSQEAAQEAIGVLNKYLNTHEIDAVLTEDIFKQLVEGAAAGMVGGGMFGAVPSIKKGIDARKTAEELDQQEFEYEVENSVPEHIQNQLMDSSYAVSRVDQTIKELEDKKAQIQKSLAAVQRTGAQAPEFDQQTTNDFDQPQKELDQSKTTRDWIGLSAKLAQTSEVIDDLKKKRRKHAQQLQEAQGRAESAKQQRMVQLERSLLSDTTLTRTRNAALDEITDYVEDYRKKIVNTIQSLHKAGAPKEEIEHFENAWSNVENLLYENVDKVRKVKPAEAWRINHIKNNALEKMRQQNIKSTEKFKKAAHKYSGISPEAARKLERAELEQAAMRRRMDSEIAQERTQAFVERGREVEARRKAEREAQRLTAQANEIQLARDIEAGAARQIDPFEAPTVIENTDVPNNVFDYPLSRKRQIVSDVINRKRRMAGKKPVSEAYIKKMSSKRADNILQNTLSGKMGEESRSILKSYTTPATASEFKNAQEAERTGDVPQNYFYDIPVDSYMDPENTPDSKSSIPNFKVFKNKSEAYSTIKNYSKEKKRQVVNALSKVLTARKKNNSDHVIPDSEIKNMSEGMLDSHIRNAIGGKYGKKIAEMMLHYPADTLTSTNDKMIQNLADSRYLEELKDAKSLKDFVRIFADKLSGQGLPYTFDEATVALKALLPNALNMRPDLGASYLKRSLLIVKDLISQNALFQSVYHGSAVRNISKFSTNFLGTGEGFQAFGWGLYFTDRKNLADYYKSVAERNNQKLMLNGVEVSPTEFIRDGVLKDIDKYPELVGEDPLKILHILEGVEDAGGFSSYRSARIKELANIRQELDDIQLAALEATEVLRKLDHTPDGKRLNFKDIDAEARKILTRGDGFTELAMKFIRNADSMSSEEVRTLDKLLVEIDPKLEMFDLQTLYDSLNIGIKFENSAKDAERAEANIELVSKLQDLSAKYKTADGQVYKVNIPDSHEMPYWDGKFDEQSEEVQQQFVKVTNKLRPDPETRRNPEGVDPDHALAADVINRHFIEGKDSDPKRRLPYRVLYDALQDIVFKSPELTSKFFLENFGFSGHRFLDGQSRKGSKSKPTYNYVMYDADAVQIEEQLYQADKATGAINGAYFRKAGRAVISLVTKNANKSTLLHEAAHVYLDNLSQKINDGFATKQEVADMQEIRKWLGKTDNKPFTRDQHETFARGFEKYLMTNEAPNSKLKRFFKMVKKWLKDVYKTAVALGVDVSPEMTKVYDRMLTGSQNSKRAGTGVKAPPVKRGTTRYQTATESAKERTVKAKEKTIKTVKEAGRSLNRATKEGKPTYLSDVRGLDHTIFSDLKTRLQDSDNPLKMFVGAVQELGGKITEHTNIYELKEAVPNVLVERVSKFKREMVDPMVRTIEKYAKNSGYTAKDVLKNIDMYLHALHAEERNEKLWKAGHTGEAPSGMTSKRARSIKNGEVFEITPELKLIAKQYKAITDFQLAVMTEYRLLPKEQIKAIREAYDNYAPLKGWDEFMENFDSKYKQRSKGVKTNLKRAVGHSAEKEIESPLINGILQTSDVIAVATRASTGRALLQLLKDNPVLKGAEDFIFQREDQAVKFKWKYDNKGNLKYERVNPFADDPNVITVIDENGKYVRLRTKDARVAQAFTGENMVVAGPIPKMIGVITRALAKLATTLNPGFIYTNPIRDVGSALINISVEKAASKKYDITDAKVRRQILNGGLKRAHKAIRQYQKGQPITDGMSETLNAFRSYGGFSEQYSLNDAESIAKSMDTAVKDAMRSGTPYGYGKNAIRSVADMLENQSNALENMTRLATFEVLEKEWRAKGMPKTEARLRAASAARNITVNFSRRGTWAPVLGPLYMFSNASIQGTARMFKTLARRPDVRNKLLVGGIAGTFMLASLNRAIGGEDDDGVSHYDKIPNWVKNNNLIMMLPFTGGKYAKLPIAYGYNIINIIGQQMDQLVNGSQSTAGAVSEIVYGMFDNFSPVGSPEAGWTTLLPTAFRPIMQLETNKGFFGQKIMPDSPSWLGYEVPDAQKYWSTVNPAAKFIADVINVGTTETRSGLIDVSPESIEHIVEAYTGGLGKTIVRGAGVLMNSAAALAGQERKTENIMKDVPIFRRMFGMTNFYSTLHKYNDAREDVARLQSEHKYAKMKGREAYKQFRSENPDYYKKNTIVENAEKRMRKYRKLKNSIRKSSRFSHETERLDKIQKLEEQTIKNMLKSLNNIK